MAGADFAAAGCLVLLEAGCFCSTGDPSTSVRESKV
jgi:hypothetical protein